MVDAMVTRRRSAHLDRRKLASALVEAANAARGNGIGDAASVIALNAVTALPAVLLSTLGLLVAVGGQGAVDGILRTADNVLPPDAISLLRGTLDRAVDNRGSGFVFAAVGIVLAVWSAMGAMGAVMRGLNRAYDVEERRGTVRRLATAFAMLALTVAAACVTAGLLALGPVLSDWLGRVSGHRDAARVIWWTAQWPLTLAALVLVFAGLIAIGPDVRSRRRGLVTAGAAIAVLLWIALSLLLALYVAHFNSYNKAWGSLSAIIVTIVWMRLSALALLFGAELDAAIERRRAHISPVSHGSAPASPPAAATASRPR